MSVTRDWPVWIARLTGNGSSLRPQADSIRATCGSGKAGIESRPSHDPGESIAIPSYPPAETLHIARPP